MRLALIALAVACAACSSSTGVDNNGTKPGPSMTGEWQATDTLQRLMVLSLTQTGDTVRGTGRIVTGGSAIDSATVVGLNVIEPPCCQPDGDCPPCALIFPVSLTLVDTAGNRLLANGSFDGKNTSRLDVQVLGESPNFPFDVVMRPSLQFTFTRQSQTLQRKTALPAVIASRQARSR